jgi:hypothetical protein
MDQHQSDQSDALSGGAVVSPTADGGEPVTAATGVASLDRETAIDGIAVTSDVADPDVQDATAGHDEPAS